ncbi:hypothetical protein LDENG_00072960 [Lucifuga dentata]|nr:hypothetical protein LDENG_00072960 [Lucifuga dentata]
MLRSLFPHWSISLSVNMLSLRIGWFSERRPSWQYLSRCERLAALPASRASPSLFVLLQGRKEELLLPHVTSRMLPNRAAM